MNKHDCSLLRTQPAGAPSACVCAVCSGLLRFALALSLESRASPRAILTVSHQNVFSLLSHRAAFETLIYDAPMCQTVLVSKQWSLLHFLPSPLHPSPLPFHPSPSRTAFTRNQHGGRFTVRPASLRETSRAHVSRARGNQGGSYGTAAHAALVR